MGVITRFTTQTTYLFVASFARTSQFVARLACLNMLTCGEPRCWFPDEIALEIMTWQKGKTTAAHKPVPGFQPREI